MFGKRHTGICRSLKSRQLAAHTHMGVIACRGEGECMIGIGGQPRESAAPQELTVCCVCFMQGRGRRYGRGSNRPKRCVCCHKSGQPRVAVDTHGYILSGSSRDMVARAGSLPPLCVPCATPLRQIVDHPLRNVRCRFLATTLKAATATLSSPPPSLSSSRPCRISNPSASD